MFVCVYVCVVHANVAQLIDLSLIVHSSISISISMHILHSFLLLFVFFLACCTFICVFFFLTQFACLSRDAKTYRFRERTGREREIERHCTSAHVECSQRNEIFTLRCSYSNASSAVCVEALRRSRRRRRARAAHVCLCACARALSACSLSLAHSCAGLPLRAVRFCLEYAK